jgi:hypothetical protein
MTRTCNLELANLVCTFGNEKVLMDYAIEIVIPAFSDSDLVRRYGEARHFFRDVSPIQLEHGPDGTVVGIAGRYIVDTVISREQTYDKNLGLVQSKASMATAPSALFLLILNNHRLLYVKETARAPSLQSFKSTLAAFLARKRKSFIESEYARLDGSTTKKKLMESIPQADLRITPVSSEESIGAFMQRFSKLKSLEIKICKRNGEVDNSGLFDKIEESGIELESNSTKLSYSNPQGLNIAGARREVVDASTSGNQLVKLQGIDENGDVLRGNNETFQLLTPIQSLKSKSPYAAARTLYNKFLQLVESNILSVPQGDETNRRVVNEKTNYLFERE